MPVNIVCNRCGTVRELTVADIKTGNWKRKPCPGCWQVEQPEAEQPPKDAA